MTKRMRMAGTVLWLLTGVVVAGCGATTNLTGMWEDPELTEGEFKKVMIIGLSDQEGRRRAFEDEMKKQFESKQVDAVASSEHMPLDDEMIEEAFKRYCEGLGIDAILVSRLVGVDQKVSYSPGYTYAVPYGYYNGFYGYYATSWGVVSSPGYLSTYEVANVETNLYRASDHKLVWSGVSETFNYSDALDRIQSFSRSVVPQLVKKGFFYRNK